MDARVREHVNLPIKQVFEVLSESDEIQERAPGLHIYKQIEVTILMVFAARHGAEQTDVVSAVARRNSKNLVPLVLQVHECACSTSILAPARG